jgi:hypothetical protein
MYTYAANVWDFPIVQGPFSIAPCQTLLVTIRNFCVAALGMLLRRTTRHLLLPETCATVRRCGLSVAASISRAYRETAHRPCCVVRVVVDASLPHTPPTMQCLTSTAPLCVRSTRTAPRSSRGSLQVQAKTQSGRAETVKVRMPSVGSVPGHGYRGFLTL